MTFPANDPRPSFALRELRREMSSAKLWAALGGAVLILALSGPFDTADFLSLPGRLLYWGVLVLACYVAGAWLNLALTPRLHRGTGLWPARLLTGLAIGGVTVLLVTALNFAAIGYLPESLAAFARMAGLILPIAVVVNLLLSLIDHGETKEEAPPALLARLPFEKRGALQALSAEDHYVRVRTSKGEELILLRLADAISETGRTPGAQVHRSHWVAWEAVARVRRDGDRAILTLRDQSEIPVSRSNIAKLRAAGFLKG